MNFRGLNFFGAAIFFLALGSCFTPRQVFAEKLNAESIATQSSQYAQAVLPFFIEDQKSQGNEDILVSIPSGIETADSPLINSLLISKAPIILSLSEWVDAHSLQKELGNFTEWLSVSQLRQFGLIVKFDPIHLEIRVYVPAALRIVQSISLTRGLDSRPQTAPVRPGAFSSFLNVNAAQDFQSVRLPAHAELEASANYLSWVLEGFATVDESVSGMARRGDMSLVKDLPEKMLRFTAGDLSYPVAGYARYIPMGGAAAFTQFNLQPYRTITPINNHEILLKTRSSVRIWVNGRLMQTLELPAGRHELRDFPFITGLNRVLLEVEDSVGRRETLDVSYVYSDQLLAAGLNQISYAAGVPWILNGTQRRYLTDQPIVSLVHRYGLTDQVTLGGFFQGSKDQKVLGISSVLASSIGTWSWDLGSSRLNSPSGGALGLGTRFGYLYTDYLGPVQTQRNLGLEFEQRTALFSPLGENNSLTQPITLLSASYSQQIFSLATASVTYRKPLSGPSSGALSNQSLSATLTRNWKSGLATTLSYTRNRFGIQEPESVLSFLLTWALPEKNQYVTATHSTQDNLSRLEWSYNPSRAKSGLNLTAGTEHSALGNGATLSGEYVADRARVSLREDVNSYVNNNVFGNTTERTAVRLGTALAFADGQFALSRPIQDSFVLVKPELNLKNELIQLNPQESGGTSGSSSAGGSGNAGWAEASTSWLGPAVISDLVSYRYAQIRIAAPDAPPDTALGQSEFIVFPSYKSAIKLTIGTSATVLAQGKLIDALGKAIPLSSGVVKPFLRPGEQKKTSPIDPQFFTNRDGIFAIEQLSPGKYELQINIESEDRTETAAFEIPSGASGLFELGTVQISQKQGGFKGGILKEK